MINKNLIGLLHCFQQHLPVVINIEGIATGNIKGVRWALELNDTAGPFIVIDATEKQIEIPKETNPYDGLFTSPLTLPDKS
jgi:hypothetical protein